MDVDWGYPYDETETTIWQVTTSVEDMDVQLQHLAAEEAWNHSGFQWPYGEDPCVEIFSGSEIEDWPGGDQQQIVDHTFKTRGFRFYVFRLNLRLQVSERQWLDCWIPISTKSMLILEALTTHHFWTPSTKWWKSIAICSMLLEYLVPWLGHLAGKRG